MDQIKRTHRIFAYGTLKRGQPNHNYLSKCVYVGTAITDQAYPLIVATHWNLPFLLDAPGEGKKVIGELYDIDDDLLEWMDNFEGHPSVYTRDLVKVNRTRIIPEQQFDAINDVSFSTTSNISSDIKDCSGIKKCSEIKSSDSTAVTVVSDVSINQSVEGTTSNVTLGSGVTIDDDINECVNSTKLINIDKSVGLSLESDKFSNTQLHANVLSCNRRVESEQEEKKASSAESDEMQNEAVVSEKVWVYLLRKFPPGLLKKESYACYDSNASHQRSYHPDNDLSGPDTIEEALELECT